jgi:hypothetical protein
MDHAMTQARTQRVTERPRYYARQLVTPTELNLEASYFLDRLRRHNRLLHGWGVICGALVCRVVDKDGKAQPWKVKIMPGALIDQYGNEIEITTERIVDLRSSGVAVSGDDPAGELDDPWCHEVWTEPKADATGTIWVAVKYHQGMARPVRVQPAGCGCDDTSCEYSRWCDGYKIGFLHQRPASCKGEPPPLDDLDGDGHIPVCPSEPDDPWVVLAEVDFEGDGRITKIDNCSCRRMIVSLAHLWWRCESSDPAIAVVTTTGEGKTADGYRRGHKDIKVTVEGSDIDQDAVADWGQGVQVTEHTVDDDGTGTTKGMTLTVAIADDAQPGPRTLTITNPDCAIATYPNALTVSSETTPKTTPKTAKTTRPTRRRARGAS